MVVCIVKVVMYTHVWLGYLTMNNTECGGLLWTDTVQYAVQ